MAKLHRLAVLTALALTITPLTACSPKTSSPVNAPVELKAGVTLSHQPVDSADLTRLRDQELIPLVEKGKISADEARAFMRAQKKRLGMANPDKTKALDQILKQKGLN